MSTPPSPHPIVQRARPPTAVIILGALLAAGGTIIAIVLLLVDLLGFTRSALTLPDVPAEGSTLTVMIDTASSQQTIYHRGDRTISEVDPGFQVDCQVLGPDEGPVPLQPVGDSDLRITTQDHRFYPRHWWQADRPGAHVVRCADGRFGVGPRAAVADVGAGIGRGVLIAGAAAAAGMVLITVASLWRVGRRPRSQPWPSQPHQGP